MMGTEGDLENKSSRTGDNDIKEHQSNEIQPRKAVQRIQPQMISPDQVIIVETRPNYFHSAKFLGLGFLLGVAFMLGLGVFLFPSKIPVEPVAEIAASLSSSDASPPKESSHSQPTATDSETKNPEIPTPVTPEPSPTENPRVTGQAPTPTPPSVEATVSSATTPTPTQTIVPTPRHQYAPVSSRTAVSKQIQSKPTITLPPELDSHAAYAQDDVADKSFTVERDGEGRIVVMKTNPNSFGSAPLIDRIGVKAKYSYLTGPEPISVTYFDSHNRVITVEVEVVGIAENGVASAIGLQPGDRLLSYGGEKLRSVQRLVFLTGMPGEAPRKLSFRHGKKIFTVEVPAGRLGVEVKNARATDASRIVPTSGMQTEN